MNGSNSKQFPVSPDSRDRRTYISTSTSLARGALKTDGRLSTRTSEFKPVLVGKSTPWVFQHFLSTFDCLNLKRVGYGVKPRWKKLSLIDFSLRSKKGVP